MAASQAEVLQASLKANELQRQIDALEKTVSGLNTVNLSGGVSGSQVSGEQKYLTKSQLLEFRSKIQGFRNEIVSRDEIIAKQAKTISDLKTRIKTELVTIKKEILVEAGSSTPRGFRDVVRDYLTKIKEEITKNPPRSNNDKSIPLSKVETVLSETKKLREELLQRENDFNKYKEQMRNKLLILKQEVSDMDNKYHQMEKEHSLVMEQNNRYRNGTKIPDKLQTALSAKLREVKDSIFQTETLNKSLKIDNLNINSTQFTPEFDINHNIYIPCIDMHTGGEPLRIIDSLRYGGIPLDIETKNKNNFTLLDKREYMLNNLDHFRKFLMYEPRGHSDMYGAIITSPDNTENGINAHFGVLFMHNEGYSTMCGHAVIALGRYAVDSGLIENNNKLGQNGNNGINGINGNDGLDSKLDENDNKEERVYKQSKIVRMQTPCGLVVAEVEINNEGKTTGNVSFLSAPGWAEQLNKSVNIDKFGDVSYDIGYGGAYYAIVPAKSVGLSVTKSSVKELVNAGTMISNKVREQLKSSPLTHPDSKTMEFLYGTILTDGNENINIKNAASNNITIFADRQVDRCPTGSGVIARLAVDNIKNLVKLNEKREYLGPIGSKFVGVIKQNGINFQGKENCVLVQVSGSANYMGSTRLYLENTDNYGKGFILR